MLRVRQRPGRYGAVLRAAQGALQGYRAGRRILSNRPRPTAAKKSSNNIVTSQKDVSVSKKRKRNIKAYKKKAAFRNKIQKALAPDQALNVYQEVQNAKFIVSNPAIPVTQYQVVNDSTAFVINMGAVYSNSTNTGYILGRYRNIEASTNANANQGAKNTINSNSFKLNILSSKLETSITNITTFPMVIDIYECYAMKDIQALNVATPWDAWTTLCNENTINNPIDATTTGTTKLTNGSTPYDCPNFGKYWGIKKKTRVLLPAGNTTEYLMYGGKYKLHGDKFENMAAIKGISKGLLIVGGIGDNTGWTTLQNVIRHVVNTTYHFKYEVGEDELPQRPTSLVRILP